MREFLIGLLVIVLIIILSGLGLLLFPLLLILGIFFRLIIFLLLTLFSIWLVGKLALLLIEVLAGNGKRR